MNYITAEKRRQAAGLVREGVSVGCARPLVRETAPDAVAPMLHFMTGSGERYEGKKTADGELQASSDFMGLVFHTYTVTHIDSLCHVFWDGKMYNGRPAGKVTTREGATTEDIDLLRDGVASRGVLLDIPKVKNVKWLKPKEGIFPEELDEAEKALNVRVGSGDILFLRTGALRRRNEEGPTNLLQEGRAGIHGACMPWVHQRQVAVLGCDGGTDVSPSGYPKVAMPVHQVGIAAMGLWLIDNANLEELAAACERYRRWEFLLTIAPLRLVHGTGSPVNPIAMF